MKIQINFVPEKEDKILFEAAKEYALVWNEWGDKIVNTLEKVTTLQFNYSPIDAVILESPPDRSHPLSFNHAHSSEAKPRVITHEMFHRLLRDARVYVSADKPENLSLEIHKFMYLVLYDVLVELFGKEGANAQIKLESTWTDKYKIAWEWALSFDNETRKEMFMTVVQKSRQNE